MSYSSLTDGSVEIMTGTLTHCIAKCKKKTTKIVLILMSSR